MAFDRIQRTTRRRSSAGPTPPRRPLGGNYDRASGHRQGARPTFLALKDHGKVFVADMPFLSDGQLANITKEAAEVLESLERRIVELEEIADQPIADRDTLIKACTKRDVTHRFLRAIEEEQQQRRENPAVLSAAGESLPRTFLAIARHRLPGATFDSLLQEALNACEQSKAQEETSNPSPVKVIPFQGKASSLPVVVSPDPDPADQAL
jgi:hypothetical protein